MKLKYEWRHAKNFDELSWQVATMKSAAHKAWFWHGMAFLYEIAIEQIRNMCEAHK